MPITVASESRDTAVRRQFLEMACHAQGRPFADWPGWSTGETIIVALLLNRADVLDAMGYTILQAVERVDLFTGDQLRSMAREL